MINQEKAQKAITMLLEAIGEDVTREGLMDTPLRVAKMYEELVQGYEEDAATHLSKMFHVKGNHIILEKDIPFHSLCEHHLLPFFGKVHIAYLPQDSVVGLSKLARLVETFARRLQLQEQLTNQIAESIEKQLSPAGVMVVVEAEHSCMTMRGVKKVGAKTITYSINGIFSEDIALQSNVLNMIKH